MCIRDRDDVLVEGNVTKVEEKSKLWIYLKNASINKKAAGEGDIVQIPVSAHSNQKRPLAGSKISVYGKLSLFSQASNPGAVSYTHLAFLCREECAALVPGDHGSTYGGNPLVCAAANAVMDQFEELNLTAHVKEVGAYLYEQLEQLTAEFDCIKAVSYTHLDVYKRQPRDFIPTTRFSTISTIPIPFAPPILFNSVTISEYFISFQMCIRDRHNTSKTNGEILDELLTKWEEMGYSFKTLEEF